MLDLLKDVANSWSQRVRSPILGSVFLAFIFVNWKATLFLLFSDASMLERIAYVEANTSYCSLIWFPILIGGGFAIVSPWITYAGGWLASKPTGRLRHLQASGEQDLRVHKMNEQAREIEAEANLEEKRAELEEAAERRKIERKKRSDEAEEIGLTLEDEIPEESETEINKKLVRQISLLTTRSKQLLKKLAQGENKVLKIKYDSRDLIESVLVADVPLEVGVDDADDFRIAVGQLLDNDFIDQRSLQRSEYILTHLGILAAEHLRQKVLAQDTGP